MDDDEILTLINDILLLDESQQADILEIISSYKNQQLPAKPVAVQVLSS